jgi:histidinol-phosphate/aromatic aminotransferase/cobyric acid decarboxylase-like protein
MAERREHGDMDAASLRALGLDPASVLDFSVNVSPFGPHEAVLAAARAADLSRYPERDGQTAREALARSLDVPASRIALGNGAAELLFSIAHALVEPSDRCLVVGPTFGEARAAFEAARGQVHEHVVSLTEEHALDTLVETLSSQIARATPRIVYLCDPNNPTGRLFGARRLARLLEAHPACAFVIDQAFLSLSAGHEDAQMRMPENALLLRSMTKDHALPGLRIAYVLASEANIERIERARPPWTTSAAAQAAVPVALAHAEHVTTARTRLLALREELEHGLARLGLTPHPSATCFLVVDVGDARAVRARLLRDDAVLVRSCVSFGLPNHIRICARPKGDLDRLLGALTRALTQ